MVRTRFVPTLPLALCILLLASLTAWAQVQGPDPALAPERVVEIQLDALMNNDDPQPNAGIAQTFALAHPNNKRVTGPLPRFEQMIRTPAYEPLLGHKSHTIERLAGDDARVQFRVEIELPDGNLLQYLWEVAKVTSGPDTGAWLTTRVSNPMRVGQAI